MGIDKKFPMAYIKSQIAWEQSSNVRGLFLFLLEMRIKKIFYCFKKINFKIYATKGTAEFLSRFGVKTKIVNKVNEGSPHVEDLIEKTDSTSHKYYIYEKSIADSFSIRRMSNKK